MPGIGVLAPAAGRSSTCRMTHQADANPIGPPVVLHEVARPWQRLRLDQQPLNHRRERRSKVRTRSARRIGHVLLRSPTPGSHVATARRNCIVQVPESGLPELATTMGIPEQHNLGGGSPPRGSVGDGKAIDDRGLCRVMCVPSNATPECLTRPRTALTLSSLQVRSYRHKRQLH